jgi:chromate transporter
VTPLALARYFLLLGTTGFGGPIALVGYMQRDLVERRAWFTAEEFSRGLALAQISPGPLAAQLAAYLGWLRGGVSGAAFTAVAFVAPSLAMVLVIAQLYVRFGTLSWLQPAFAAVGAAVVGVLVRSALKLARMTLSRDGGLWAIATANTIGVLTLRRESLIILVIGGAAALADRIPTMRGAMTMAPLFLTRPLSMSLALSQFVLLPQLWQLFHYFAVAGIVVFGSGLAIIPYLFHGVVEQHHWLTSRQFLDAIAVSMITPGPVVITVAFIGYLVAGTAGALISALAVFLPAWLLVVAFAPHFERIRRNATVRRFVDGIIAGATGAIAGAAILLSARILTTVEAVVIAIVVVLAISTKPRVPEAIAIVGAGFVGVALG